MKNKLIYFAVILIGIISLSGCISNKSSYNPDVSIGNVSNHNYNVTLIINNNDKEIYNITITLLSNCSSELTHIKVPNKYVFKIILDDNRTLIENKQYDEYVTRIYISISNDDIKIHEKVV